MLPMRTTTGVGTNRIADLTAGGSPFSLIDEMRREMDRVFERALGSWDDPFLAPARSRLAGGGSTWMPTMDVQETDRELRLTLEVPGLDPEELHVDVDDDVLTISGEKRIERDENEGGYRLIERRAGRFERRVPLPNHVDAEHVTAEYEHGVLLVTIPKKAGARKSRRVQISGGGLLRRLSGRGKKEGEERRDVNSQREGNGHRKS